MPKLNNEREVIDALNNIVGQGGLAAQVPYLRDGFEANFLTHVPQPGDTNAQMLRRFTDACVPNARYVGTLDPGVIQDWVDTVKARGAGARALDDSKRRAGTSGGNDDDDDNVQDGAATLEYLTEKTTDIAGDLAKTTKRTELGERIAGTSTKMNDWGCDTLQQAKDVRKTLKYMVDNKSSFFKQGGGRDEKAAENAIIEAMGNDKRPFEQYLGALEPLCYGNPKKAKAVLDGDKTLDEAVNDVKRPTIIRRTPRQTDLPTTGEGKKGESGPH